MPRPDEAKVLQMRPVTGTKAGAGQDRESRVMPADAEYKVPCQWEAPVPDWLWAWAGMVKVKKEKAENGGGRQSGRLTTKEDL